MELDKSRLNTEFEVSSFNHYRNKTESHPKTWENRNSKLIFEQTDLICSCSASYSSCNVCEVAAVGNSDEKLNFTKQILKFASLK